MKKSITLILIAAFSLCLFLSCIAIAQDVKTLPTSRARLMDQSGSTVSNISIEHFNLAGSKIAIGGYSPVSYFEKGIAEKGNSEFTAVHNGITFYFTNAEQRDKFSKNPNKYLPAYGGWCAYGMAQGKKFPINPTSFKVVDGKLMLFLHNEKADALTLWNKEDEQHQVIQANQNWIKVTSNNPA